MMKAFENFLLPADLEDEQKRSEYRMLRSTIMLGGLGSLLMGATDFLISRHTQTPIITTLLLLLWGTAGYLLWQGKEALVRQIIPGGLLIGLTLIIWRSNGGIHSTTMFTLPLVVILGALLNGQRGALIYGALSILATTLIGLAEINGWLVNAYSQFTTLAEPAGVAIILLIITGLLYLIVTRLNQTARRAAKNADAQAQANQELRALQTSLEEKIAERTQALAQESEQMQERAAQIEKANITIQHQAAQLQSLAEVSRKTARVRDISTLLQSITEIISAEFGFYHVAIFLKDTSGNYATLAASNSKGGQRLLKRGLKIRSGEGLVGAALKTGQPQTLEIMSDDKPPFNAPELKSSRAELALTLQPGEQITGVLDLHSQEADAFSEDSIHTLAILANQAAIAIENARLFSDSTRALDEAQAVYQQYLRGEWSRTTSEAPFAGFRNSPLGPQALNAGLDLPEIRQVTRAGTSLSAEKGETNALLAVPLKVRDQVVGVLNIRAANEIDEITRDEIDLIQAVAERVGLSMENARLFEETSRRAEREKTISEITSKIRGTNDPSEMLEIALAEIQQALKVQSIRIIQGNSPADK